MELDSIANTFAWMSLICSLSFWLIAPRFDISGLWWLGITAVGIFFAGIAAVGRSKLSFAAVPIALGMFFFIMFVNGS